MGSEPWQATLLTWLIYYLIIVLIITVHEWAHAWMANRCGDPTARYLGRMTLNPLPHLDIIGTVILPLVMISGMLGGFGVLGWGKPVPVNPANLRNYRRDDILVSMAGPFSNVVLALLALVAVRLLGMWPSAYAETAREMFFAPLALISFFLAFFNLLPVPPLDGSHVVRHMLSWRAQQMYDAIGRYGFILLLVFINTPLSDMYFTAVMYVYAVFNIIIAGA